MRLKDKVAIITGGAHGMGEAEARLFAAEGAKVVVADILADDAEAVAATIRSGGGTAISAKIDLTSEAESPGLIGKSVAAYGRLDILVNNAGISGSSVGDPDGLDGWPRIFAVNQTSVFSRKEAWGRADGQDRCRSIVNISSITGFVGGTGGHPAYHASKRARCGSIRRPRRCAMCPRECGWGQYGSSGLHAKRHPCRRARRQSLPDFGCQDIDNCPRAVLCVL